jgi:hypothetical protein
MEVHSKGEKLAAADLSTAESSSKRRRSEDLPSAGGHMLSFIITPNNYVGSICAVLCCLPIDIELYF